MLMNMPMVKIDEYDSPIAQAIAITDFIRYLTQNDFLNSDYYNKTCNMSSFNRTNLETSKIDNPVMLQMLLYALLCMGYEIFKQENLEMNYDNLNIQLSNYIEIQDNSYTGQTFNYVKHLRNAISHTRIEYKEDNGLHYVLFKDRNNSNQETCVMKINNFHLGHVLQIVYDFFFDYIKDKYHIITINLG